MLSILKCLITSFASIFLELLSGIANFIDQLINPLPEEPTNTKQPLTPFQCECLERVTKTGQELRFLVLQKNNPGYVQVSRRSQDGKCECINCYYDRYIDDFRPSVPETKILQYSDDDSDQDQEDLKINVQSVNKYVKKLANTYSQKANNYLSDYTRTQKPHVNNFSATGNYFAFCLTQEESCLPEDCHFNFGKIEGMKRRLPETENYVKAAIVSRGIVFVIQYVSSRILPHHNNDGFKFIPEDDYGSFMDTFVNNTFSGLSNWDGQYFLHIATKGYTDENLMAFFPLYPVTVSIVSKIFYLILFPVMSFSSLALVVGLVLNFLFFLKSVIILRDISKRCDRGLDNLTDIVVLLYCYNPASIFFSAFYTESMFSYFTINVFHALITSNIMKAVIMASMSAICRSNGLLNFGLVAAYIIRNALWENGPLRKDKHENRLVSVVLGFLMIVVGLIPFAIFQIYVIQRFCNDVDVADLPPYCTSLLTMPYQYIQKEYWNVGFLNYFEAKQIPNFLLAAPVLCVTLYECLKRLRLYLLYIIQNRYYDCIGDLSMTLHGVFLVLFCFLCIHVQVSTRLILSACPYLYIYIAKSHRMEVCQYRKQEIEFPFFSAFIYIWSFIYYIVGTIMFSVGLPWT